MDDVAAWTPVVSAAAQMRIGKYAINVPVFGVDPVSYFDVCSDIAIDLGDVSALSDGGVFINSAIVAGAQAYLGRPARAWRTYTIQHVLRRQLPHKEGPLRGYP